MSSQVRQVLMKIGTTEAYATRKAYLEDIRVRAATSKTLIEERIAAVDPNPNAEERTYQGRTKKCMYGDSTSISVRASARMAKKWLQ